MDGLLAKYISLATHGTLWLRNQSTAIPDLRVANGPFADVGDVSFGRVSGVDAWLRALAENGVERIWLSVNRALYFSIGRPHEPLWYRDVAFAEGINGCAGLMVRDCEIWRATLDTASHAAADGRTWKASFASERTLAKPETPSMSSAIDRLERRIDRAAAFARDHDFAPWDTVLADARALGAAEEPAGPRPSDLFPDHGFTPGSRRLAAMARAAWVFGGVGSWNDRRFNDPTVEVEYRWVSRDLFAAVMTAFAAAVNSKLSNIRR